MYQRKVSILFWHRHFSMHARAHTHTRARARVFFNTDAFRCANFYTVVPVHRNTFAERCFHTEMASHTHTETPFLSHTHTHADTFLHRDDCTLSKFLRTDTITNGGAFTKEWIYTKSCYIRDVFTQGILLHDFHGGHAFRATSVQQADVQTAISSQLLALETHFVGKGWPSPSPHCNFISFLGDRHFRATGCVSWT